VIACGGGGAPIYDDPVKGWEGIDAVVDKDLASAVLARDLGAGLLLKAALWTAGVGGVLALLVISVRTVWQSVRKGKAAPKTAASESIPYAPAITLGVLLALVAQG